MRGKNIKIFVMGAEPSSLKKVEIVNWTGKAYIGRRDQIHQVRQRKDLEQPSIYFLLATDSSESELTDFYVGETDDFVRRISEHAAAKDWWTHFVVFASSDMNLTKAHVKYLENKFYHLAKKSVEVLEVRNSSPPSVVDLPESDQASTDEFMDNMIFLLETMGLSYFIKETRVLPDQAENDLSALNNQKFIITHSREAGENARATMEIQNGSYIVKSGSYIKKDAQDSFSKHDHNYYKLWKQIIESDAVSVCEFAGLLKATRDLSFRSPSAAGSIVRGRSTNGRTEWKRVSDGISFADVEKEVIKRSA